MAESSPAIEIRQDLAKFARVSRVLSNTQFVSNDIAGEQQESFAGYSVYVLAKFDGSNTAPKNDTPVAIADFQGIGAISPIVRGTVTHAAFTAPLSVGDSVLLIHPALSAAIITNNYIGGGGGAPPPPPVTSINNSVFEMTSRPRNELNEGWTQEPTGVGGINASLWAVTNPATGTAWQNTAFDEWMVALTQPNASETARLISRQRWVCGPTTYGINKINRRLTFEFEMALANLANFDNTLFLMGLTPTNVATRATNSIIGFALVGGGNALQTVTDLAGVETVNTGFGETLTNKNKFRIDVYLNTVDFYLNETRIAQHLTNLPSLPMYLNFNLAATAAGLILFRLGTIRAWTEDFAR